MVVCVCFTFAELILTGRQRYYLRLGLVSIFYFCLFVVVFSSHFDVSHVLNFKRLRYQKYIRCREGPVGETGCLVAPRI